MDLGAEDYLPKPCPADKLVSVIRMRLTRRRRLQKELADQWRGMGLRHLTLPLDIGNPLRQILGFAGVLIAQGADLGPEEIRQVAHDVGMAGFRLTRKVTQLRLREALELRQQVDWGESEAHCDAELVLRRAVKQCVVFGPRVRDMVSSIEPGTLMIREGIVGAVLAELLDNALRYSTPGSPVRLLGEVTAEGYRVSVENQISEAVGERVAERLRVTDAGSPVGTQCSGLTVVRALLQSCKIEPEIESDPSGRIVAHFTIPVAQLY
jgi:signal transduction histidine kinase